MTPPNVVHRRLANPHVAGQGATAPLGSAPGFGLQGGVDDGLHFLPTIAGLAPPTGGNLPQTRQTLLGKARAPEHHRLAIDLVLLRDRVIGLTGSGRQHDPATQGDLLWGTVGRSPLLKLPLVSFAEG